MMAMMPHIFRKRQIKYEAGLGSLTMLTLAKLYGQNRTRKVRVSQFTPARNLDQGRPAELLKTQSLSSLGRVAGRGAFGVKETMGAIV